MTLPDFINCHAGETAWLFGKGPSLSTFNFETAGPLRVAINDVVKYVPNCVYGFSNDGVEKWKDVYTAGQVLFQPVRCMGEYDPRNGGVACDVCAFQDDYNDDRLTWSREELAMHGPTVRRGTLGSALQILYIMGVKEIHLIGIDGGNAHAPGFEWRTRLRAEHWKDYNAIRHAAIDAAEILGITLKFHNHDHTMENDGKVFIRITRNCLAGGVHRCLGEIVKINPRTAGELIAADSAQYYDPPAKPEPIVETAAAAPVAEVAAITPKKRGRPSKSKK